MCQVTGTPPSLACTLGDLKPGQQIHDPNGETWMVTNLPRTADDTIMVNIGNGATNWFGNALTNDEFKGLVTPMYNDVKLGYDHKGRLYASTHLNDWKYDEPMPDYNLGSDVVGCPVDTIPPGQDDATIKSLLDQMGM